MSQEILLMGGKPSVSGTLTLCAVRPTSDFLPDRSLGESIQADNVESRLTHTLFWFEDASKAVQAGIRLVDEYGVKLAVGIATAVATEADQYEDLRALAMAIADIAEGGELLVCLATQELTRRGLTSSQSFSEVGIRRVASGHVTRLFLFSSSDPAAGQSLERAHSVWNPQKFIGRAREIEALKLELAISRFIYLSGPPGIGKTSLVARVATELEEDYADGVLWLNLGKINRRSLLLHRLASVLEIPYCSEPTLLKQIARTIGQKSFLIVLDEVSNLQEEIEEIAEALLPCANTSIVCTAIKRPSSSVARSMSLDGLDYPLPSESFDSLSGYDAINFFVESGRKVSPNFALTERNYKHVLQIIYLLEGSPWAMQMVASRLGILPPKTLLARLRDDPFAILNDPNVQSATLASALKTVLDTLNPWSQTLFKRLWIFQGTFSADTVSEVCSDDSLPESAIFSSLKDLLDVHLIHPFPLSEDRRVFTMGSVSREFSQKESGLHDRKELKAKMASFLVRRGKELFGKGLTSELEGLQEFEILYDDFRHKWLSDCTSRPLIAKVIEDLTLCGNYWFQRNQFQEGVEILTFVSEQPYAGSAPKFLSLQTLLAWFHIKLGDYEGAATILRPAIRKALKRQDNLQVAKLLNPCSAVFSNCDRGRSAVRTSRYLVRLAPNEGAFTQTAQTNLASQLVTIGKHDEALRILREVEEQRGKEKSWFDVFFVSTYTYAEASKGNLDSAVEHLKLACEIVETHPYDDTLPTLYLNGCRIFIRGGRHYTASELLQAVRDMNEYHGFLCCLRRENLMRRYDEILGNAPSGIASKWDASRPLRLLRQALDNW